MSTVAHIERLVRRFFHRTAAALWVRPLAIALLALLVVLSFGGHHVSAQSDSAPRDASTPVIPTVAPSTTTELRGTWLTNIDSGVLLSAVQTAAGVQRLANLGINTIYPTVWNWGYSLYPSAVVGDAVGTPVDPHPGLVDRDLLGEILRAGHDANMSVIPWFEFGLMAPSYSELARRHPDWLARRQDGSQVFMQGRHPRVWLNPLHPEVQTFFVDLITEVVSTYDIDGIQFDDHFSWPVEFGYDAYTIDQYRRSHAGEYPPDDPHDPGWMAWRANRLTALMEQIVTAVKRNRPDAIMSLSPNALPFAYDNYLQAWDQWQQAGWIDQLIVQIYRPTVSAFTEELERVIATNIQGYSSVGIGILAGLKNRALDPSLIAGQVAAVRENGLGGVSFFFFESMRDNAISPLFSAATNGEQER
ncbi:MAG: family 10 glycosylhydrolase [Elainellaceae cyanobacterium]